MLAIIVIFVMMTIVIKCIGRVLEFGMDLLLVAGIIIAFTAILIN